MEFTVEPAGFSGTRLTVRSGDFLRGPKLLVNGQPAAKGPKRGQFLVPRGSGPAAVAHLRNSQWLVDPMPRLTLEGAEVRLGDPLPWYLVAWAALPFLLVTVGGALGAGLGMLGVIANGRVLRSSLPTPTRLGVTLAISLATLVLYLGLAIALSAGLRSLR